MTLFQIDFEPVGKRVDADGNLSILSAAQDAGIALTAVCGGSGICGACKVQLMTGKLSQVTSVERKFFTDDALNAGWRLACQAFPLSDVKIDIPPESLTTTQRLQLEGIDQSVELAAFVSAKPIKLSPPDLQDLRADWERLMDFFRQEGLEVRADLPVMAQFSNLMRETDWSGQAVLSKDRTIVGFLEPDKPLFGLAVDIGTTKMAFFLVNLLDGRVVAKAGVMNPQISYGEDVVARIAHANQSEPNRTSLQRKLVETVNKTIEALCRLVGTEPSQVVDLVVVGNTAMHHFFAGLPVRQLGQAPYVAATINALQFPAREIGLACAPGAKVYLPPNIAGYVGGDHIAMLLASRIDKQDGISIVVDIGTNTEISLAKEGQIFTCSCASGPAFEGAHINAGMRAVPGAIERAQFFGGDWHFTTVDGELPIGICGSGILDVISEMLDSGQIDEAGRFTDKAFRKVEHPQGGAIELVTRERSGTGKPILVTRGDIREIQLAEAAIRSGIEVLLAHTGTQPEEISRFLVAGAFGTYLNLESAVRIGMFPGLLHDRFDQIGNAAGIGARMMLVSEPSRQEAEALLARITYIELTTVTGYMDSYVNAITFNSKR